VAINSNDLMQIAVLPTASETALTGASVSSADGAPTVNHMAGLGMFFVGIGLAAWGLHCAFHSTMLERPAPTAPP
jgi:hypothetical protein